MYQNHFLLALSDVNGDLAGQEHGQGRALWNWRLVEQGRLRGRTTWCQQILVQYTVHVREL